MIDPKRFDFPNIFGVVKATEGLKSRQDRSLMAKIREIAMAKYSDGQIKYVGDDAKGKDFEGSDGIFYESKGMDGMFCKTKPKTKEITLMNFQGNNTGLPDKTFDYMLLWDTKTYSVGICSWDACMKNAKLKDDSVKISIHFDDIEFLAKDIIPTDKGDIGATIYNLIEQSI
tara:strand:- start:44 stop:559 length:516 start_codon:yes stop_codon:yes gene_type:complete